MSSEYNKNKSGHSQKPAPQNWKVFMLALAAVVGYNGFPKIFEDNGGPIAGVAVLLFLLVLVVILASKRKVDGRRGETNRISKSAKSNSVRRTSSGRSVLQKKTGTGGKSARKTILLPVGREHTHDKNDREDFDPNETPEEHYLKQLDGFLRAGIIDKKEYDVLSSKYRK